MGYEGGEGNSTREREGGQALPWILWLPATEERATYHRGDGASSTASNFLTLSSAFSPVLPRRSSHTV